MLLGDERSVWRLWTLLALCGFLATPARAWAQCTSNASSCVSCHETQGLRSVLLSAHPWHVDHGFGDLCAACHAGQPEAAAKEAAHLGRRPHPLEDPASSCLGCHPDYAAKAERYLAALVALPPPSPPSSAPPAADAAPERSVAAVDRALAGLAVLLGLALYVVIRRSRTPASLSIGARLRDETWDPHAAGALLGLVVAFAAVVCGRPLAASGAFDKLAAYPGAWLFPESQYYAHVMSPGITWQVWLIVGISIGSWTSSRVSGQARLRWLPDTQWVPRFGGGRGLRLLIAFFGAALVQLGAGIAGGCTSGLAISGGAVLAPAAFLFMAGMFAGGIPTAWLWYRGRPL